MSFRPIARSADLGRLLADGFDIAIRANHLVVRRIPYVNSEGQVKLGTLITRLRLANDITRQPDDHTIYFSGDYPCNKDGVEIAGIRNSSGLTTFCEGLTADHQFSAKPQPKGNYDDYYEKIVTYAGLLSGPAQLVDPTVKPNPGGFVAADEGEDSIFCYMDTASPRAEITAITAKLECSKVVIIGMGGTGGYVLDQLAKTPVEQIHIYDGDRFEQHNAFRAPGAASGDELEAEPMKVDYFAGIYGRMHRGIHPHAVYVDGSNIDELRDADFVFICIDDGEARELIIDKLEEFGRSFIDVGMGIYVHEGTLGGIVRTTTSTPEKRDHVRGKKRVSFAKTDDENDYNRNIQVADLNALNAILAVIRWKKLFGFYLDQEREHHSTYAIGGNDITNEDDA